MRSSRATWWPVLGGSLLLVVVALSLVLADTSSEPGIRPADDFGVTGSASAQRAEPPTPTVFPRARTVPVVPADARRPATLSAASTDTRTPVRVAIPAVDVDVAVVPVGVDPEGLMEIPASGQQVGWYRHGPAPGDERGSAVLASHVNTRAEGAGVLAALGDLDAGDVVTVSMDDGQTLEFVVTERRTVAKTELDTAALFARTGPARLALVTCGGPWLEESSSYRDNIIVLAEPVPGTG